MSTSKYQVLSDIEHVLKRPGMYIGSNQLISQEMYIMDDNDKIVKRDINYVPGLETIYEEVLLNAFDQTTREGTDCNEIHVDINKETGTISIYNNGNGIEISKQEVMINNKSNLLYIPEIIFGMLRSGSNYDDTEERTTGGTNGLGSKVANIYSKSFIVETVDISKNKLFKVEWTNNMSIKSDPIISSYRKKPYTRITFTPDLERFGISELSDDIIRLMKKRLVDVGFASKDKVKTYYNGQAYCIKKPEEYMKLYIPDGVDNIPIVDCSNEQWTIGIMYSDAGYQQTSFVNGIHTRNGGSHVDYVNAMICPEIIKKILKTKKIELKTSDVKSKIHIFIKSFIVNPIFNSQTKDVLKMSKTKFGSEYKMNDKFLAKILKSNIVAYLTASADTKALTELSKTSGSKTNRIIGIKGLEDANNAGTQYSENCKLILTEGLSAKTFAMSAISVIGRDKYGIFPLKGKLLNVRGETNKIIMANAEICNIVKILGLKYGESYTSISKLRYGGIIILTDADVDGHHICGLIINFFHNFWPELISMNYINICSTPIVKVSKGSESLSFLSLNDFKLWEESTRNSHTYNIKYYKGLGTSTAKEAKECLEDIANKITVFGNDLNANNSIELAFNKKLADERKTWLMDRYNPSDNIDRNLKQISVSDFINKEFIHFSYYDNQRSLPNIMDGLKPSQRKILYAAIKYTSNSEMKVAQFSAKVAEKTDYHHGEESLNKAIVGMGQNYMGSNNINLLEPLGGFGTRLNKKDSASPRYIFTKLSEMSKVLFNKDDFKLLKYLESDNMTIEPEWYVPIIPTVLVNGSSGIGSGFSTDILKYNPIDLCVYIVNKLNNKPVQEHIDPWYRGFKGKLYREGKNKYRSEGVFTIIPELRMLKITELPINVWTDDYKFILENMLADKASLVHDIRFNHSDVSIDFEITFNVTNFKKIQEMSKDEIVSMFKLASKLSCTNMYMFNHKHVITKYDTIFDILEEFYEIRLDYYAKRKQSILDLLSADLSILSNKARFIRYIKNSKINIGQMSNDDLTKALIQQKFDQIPTTDKEFKYLIDMPIRTITNENAAKLENECDKVSTHIDEVNKTTVESMWKADLKQLIQLNKETNANLEAEINSIASKKPSSSGKKPRKLKR